jgi:hypothetical protein
VGLAGLILCTWDGTAVLVPVDQLYCAHPDQLEHEFTAWVMESPSAAIDVMPVGVDAAAFAAEAVPSVPVSRSAAAETVARARRTLVETRMEDS